MAEAGRAGRSATVLAALTIAGDLLMLQLAFLVLGLGVVTLIPAAIALQRVLPEAIAQEHASLLRRFWRQFGWALRRFWAPGLGLCALAVALVTAVLFWSATPGPVRIVALALLIPLAGLAVGLYLAVLAVLPAADDAVTTRALVAAGAWFLQRHPLAVAAAVIAFATWVLLLMRLPTFVVVGSGLVPALLAHALVRGRRRV
ncbi:DUF624 domain-containing protein [Pseudonocardia sp. GCM10023141]|uniref:DUF624 domain-containing protein n=1 Tax=Pseudonocardia sp. GCM10023141 TaxID=3252653 RepID=UPI003612465C